MITNSTRFITHLSKVGLDKLGTANSRLVGIGYHLRSLVQSKFTPQSNPLEIERKGSRIVALRQKSKLWAVFSRFVVQHFHFGELQQGLGQFCFRKTRCFSKLGFLNVEVF